MFAPELMFPRNPPLELNILTAPYIVSATYRLSLLSKNKEFGELSWSIPFPEGTMVDRKLPVELNFWTLPLP